MATLQEQYNECVHVKLCLGFDERSARAMCRNQLLRLRQREQVRRGQPIDVRLDLEDMPVEPPREPVEPVEPGIVSEYFPPAPAELGVPEGVSLPRIQPARRRRKHV